MKAAIAGSTGFIGKRLIEKLSQDASFDQVDVLARRPIQLPQKFNILVNEDIASQNLEAVDVAFCALGTTIKTAGSQDAFYHVDHDLVLDFAKNVKSAGAKIFVLVSAVGANPKASNFYLRVKGETERDLEAIGFDTLIILRPSMLMGERKEFRLGEFLGKGFMTIVNPLLVGPMAKYRGVEGGTVANAMVKLSKGGLSGKHVVEGDDLFVFRQNSL